MKKIIFYVLMAAVCSLIGFGIAKFVFVDKNPILDLVTAPDRSLDKYSIENLSKTDIKEGKLTIDQENKLFSFDFYPALDDKIASTSGQIRIPGEGEYPVIVMIRGYADKEIYHTGIGTQRAAEVFERNGYITIAPDFLGYGNSSPESNILFESRFQTYTTVLSLLKSLDQVPEWDGENVFIWAHSNGGQIALTTLEVTGLTYPTTLWAPVSSPFPYSILYFTDELHDYGKYLRGELAKFEEVYDVNKYSVHSYLDRIRAPIQLHQGLSDESVPVKWSDTFEKSLEEKEIDITYYKYPATNHNMVPSWETVVQRDLQFFNTHKE